MRVRVRTRVRATHTRPRVWYLGGGGGGLLQRLRLELADETVAQNGGGGGRELPLGALLEAVAGHELGHDFLGDRAVVAVGHDAAVVAHDGEQLLLQHHGVQVDWSGWGWGLG